MSLWRCSGNLFSIFVAASQQYELHCWTPKTNGSGDHQGYTVTLYLKIYFTGHIYKMWLLILQTWYNLSVWNHISTREDFLSGFCFRENILFNATNHMARNMISCACHPSVLSVHTLLQLTYITPCNTTKCAISKFLIPAKILMTVSMKVSWYQLLWGM